MAGTQTPTFWYEEAGAKAAALSPAAWLYGAVSGRRMRRTPHYAARVPVICVGNFIAGGAGKTPAAITLAKTAIKKGHQPGFLSRGYGGSLSGPHLVDSHIDTALTVGDEALLLAKHGPTMVSGDRVAGAKALEQTGISLIIMDDGFQNPSLFKDYSLAVLDSSRAIGNGRVHPAGPLRAPLHVQMAQASALLVVGTAQGSVPVVRKAARMAKPVMAAHVQVPEPALWEGKTVLAYTGIGDPDKFFRSLEAVGASIVERRIFPDHHAYSAADCEDLLQAAQDLNVPLATTEKDKVRLTGQGEKHARLYAQSDALPVELAFENPRHAEAVVEQAFARFRRRPEPFRYG